ncbi:hypothetical protein L3081_14280 [Colwellia sp. MSW7]|uniref:Uncharacterized protein n=1 Tax=Colwellia maritima TaxID=2912588 RepID=A0ABS9X3G2_9GAMM|nr:hypothetical protein [Colwellia maritima]MCI2284337.1 hypothetical protein [Colwellia maritima]
MSFKENFKKLITKLKSKTVITILGFTCLALLIWFGGPLIAIAGYEPLISISARIILLLIIIIIWGAIKFTTKLKIKNKVKKWLITLLMARRVVQRAQLTIR